MNTVSAPWPRLDNGEPEPPALLLETADHQQLLNTQIMLAAMGIPFLTQNPNPAIFTTVLFGTHIIGGNLFVPHSLLHDAQTLMSIDN